MPMDEVVVETVEAEAPPPPSPPTNGKKKKSKRIFSLTSKDEDLADDRPEPIRFPNEHPAPQEPRTGAKRIRRPDEPIRDWLTSLGTGQLFKISVIRTKPTGNVRGRKVDGYLGSYSDYISDEELQNQYGGGTYQLKITKPNEKGVWQYFASTSIDIAGEPRLDNLPNNDAAAGPAQADPLSNPLIGMAWKEMQASKDKAEDEVRRSRMEAQSASGNLFPQLAMLMKPLELQIEQMRIENERKDAQIRELAKPRETMQDQFVQNMLFKGDTRLTEQKTMFDSEMRMVKENQRDEIKRLEDKFEREKDQQNRTHEREFSNMKASFERELANMKAQYDREISHMKQSQEMTKVATDTSASVQRTVLERDNQRLERQVEQLTIELKEQRAKKEVGLKEQIENIKSVKEILSDGDEGSDDKSTIEKITEIVVNSDKLAGVANKYLGGNNEQQQQAAAAQAAAQQPPPRPKPKLVKHRGTGQVFKMNPDGSTVPVRQRRADGTEEPVINLNPEDIRRAVGLLEGACASGVDPKVVAISARSAIPEPIMLAIRREGMDGFLNKVVQLEAASPLNTQAGRNWLRKVAKELLGEE